MQEEGEGLEGVMEERRQQLSATCAAASLRQDESNEKRFEAGDQRFNQDLTKESFLVDHNRRLLYCWNHKASYWPPCVFTFVVSGCLQLLDVAFHKTGNRKGSRSGQPPARTSMKNVLRHMTRKGRCTRSKMKWLLAQTRSCCKPQGNTRASCWSGGHTPP